VQTIVAAAERILSQKHGKRYFRYQSNKEGSFEFGPNEEGCALENRLDGKFVIKTTEANFSLRDVVFKYKDLMEVEDSFRELKDFIRVAPVRHWRYRRVKAHFFICVLALLLERYLREKLKKAGLEFSAREALERLKNIRVVENRVGHLNLKYVTPPTQELDRILAACGIFKLPRILSDGYAKGDHQPKRKPALNWLK
jgi:transposase